MRRVPWSTWLVGWLAAIVLAGGVAEVWAEWRRPEVETVVHDVVVLPRGQAKVTGTVELLRGSDVVGPPIPLPIERPSGTVTIRHGAETIVWNGGRPFRLAGEGALDPGPSRVLVRPDRVEWTFSGPIVLLPGRYDVQSPVAVGRAGLARPHDRYAFVAGGDTTIEVADTIATPLAALHLEGPGVVRLVGRFDVETRAGRRTAEVIQFGPGPFVIDLTAGLRITATLQGPLELSP